MIRGKVIFFCCREDSTCSRGRIERCEKKILLVLRVVEIVVLLHCLKRNEDCITDEETRQGRRTRQWAGTNSASARVNDDRHK